MSEKTSTPAGGLPWTWGLFLVFLLLKLCGVIGWSWWWVTAPLWGGLALVLTLTFGTVLLAGVIALAVFIGVAVFAFIARLFRL